MPGPLLLITVELGPASCRSQRRHLPSQLPQTHAHDEKYTQDCSGGGGEGAPSVAVVTRLGGRL